jgi:hypothetical protein
MDIDHNATVVVELGILIDAPPDEIWALHIGVDDWPSWNTGISRARLTGVFAPGAVFDWETAGLSITSTVHEVEDQTRTAWGGSAHGIEGIHVWTFDDTAEGVLVRTAESWEGDPVRADPQAMTTGLQSSLQSWLEALKAAAEQG